MNNVYDLLEITELQKKQNGLIVRYIIYLICFFASVLLLLFAIEDNLLLTAIFAFVLLFFIFFSILFWKIKYGILNSYRSFLDDLETGKQDDYVGVYKRKVCIDCKGIGFDEYIFISSAKERAFRVLCECEIGFDEEKEYHLVYIGDYLYQWEILG